ncbi:hypothetical protein [Escherichia coli]|uniref:hypothetical protein n=1 Tax=Escherichia coli TaxID=562 RepID=UPI001FCDDCDA|nr:hypothetical protein [Escherichia coli]
MESNIKGLVSAGHEMASELKAECGAVDMRSVAKLISDLATQLEVQLVRANALSEDHQKAIESIKQADAAVKLAHEKFSALAAENELARKAVQAFCDVVGDNTEVIAEVVGRDGVLVILEAMKATGNMPATDAFLAGDYFTLLTEEYGKYMGGPRVIAVGVTLKINLLLGISRLNAITCYLH